MPEKHSLQLLFNTFCCEINNNKKNLAHVSPVLFRNEGIKANFCYKSYQSVLIRNSFYACAAQSGYSSRLTAVKGNIKNEGLAMVQDQCDPKNRGCANQTAFLFLYSVYCAVCFRCRIIY